MSENEGGWKSMEKEEDWTFTEMQIHAKGYLRGIIVGMCLAALLISLGINIYLLLIL